jgi:cytosolic prostaglandin-E synthase
LCTSTNIRYIRETATPMAAAVNTAPIKWAQRSDFLYVTIDLHGVTNESITFEETRMHFKGTTQEDGKYFEANIEFYKPIIPEESKYKVHPLGVEMVVKKSKEKSGADEGFWPQLLKDKSLEKNEVTVDWNHYIDEDGEESDSTHPFIWY